MPDSLVAGEMSDGEQDLIEIIGSEGLVPWAREQLNRRCDQAQGHHGQTRTTGAGTPWHRLLQGL